MFIIYSITNPIFEASTIGNMVFEMVLNILAFITLHPISKKISGSVPPSDIEPRQGDVQPQAT